MFLLKPLILFDPSINSPNAGDEIIMLSVRKEIAQLFPNVPVEALATQRFLRLREVWRAKHSTVSIVGGTNLISSNMDVYRQWRLRRRDLWLVRPVVLLGVGWWQYQESPNLYTRRFLNTLLHHQLVHSVRDRYSLDKLQSIGFANVVNTGCPSMWGLTPEHCQQIPRQKASNVVTALTDYARDREGDRTLLEILQQNYSRVFLWSQSAADAEYATMLHPGLEVIDTLKSYDSILESRLDLDYVGTRLHGGIRALQYGRRTILIGVDNRAQEIARDFKLPLVSRGEVASNLAEFVRSGFSTNVVLPTQAISAWRSQFSQDLAA